MDDAINDAAVAEDRRLVYPSRHDWGWMDLGEHYAEWLDAAYSMINRLALERDKERARGDGLAADLATCVRLRDQALAEVENLSRDCGDLSEMVGEVAAQRDKAISERDTARADSRDLSEAVKAAWHQCNSAGLNREQYAALHRAFEIAVARQVG